MASADLDQCPSVGLRSDREGPDQWRFPVACVAASACQILAPTLRIVDPYLPPMAARLSREGMLLRVGGVRARCEGLPFPNSPHRTTKQGTETPRNCTRANTLLLPHEFQVHSRFLL